MGDGGWGILDGGGALFKSHFKSNTYQRKILNFFTRERQLSPSSSSSPPFADLNICLDDWSVEKHDSLSIFSVVTNDEISVFVKLRDDTVVICPGQKHLEVS